MHLTKALLARWCDSWIFDASKSKLKSKLSSICMRPLEDINFQIGNHVWACPWTWVPAMVSTQVGKTAVTTWKETTSPVQALPGRTVGPGLGYLYGFFTWFLVISTCPPNRSRMVLNGSSKVHGYPRWKRHDKQRENLRRNSRRTSRNYSRILT